MKIASSILFALFFGVASAEAQLVNTGQILTVGDSALLYVNDNYVHRAGNVLNKGTFIIKKDWYNDDPDSYVFSIASTGEVQLTGGEQIIGGQFKTIFPSLFLSGVGYKKLEADADIVGQLFLNDMEFRTHTSTLSIINPDPEAVQRTSGFISTDENGKLIRKLNSANSYIFPLGSSRSNSGINLYRPVKITTKDAVENRFALSLIPQDPTLSGYDRQSKKEDIQAVGDKYFYLVSQTSGNSASDFKFLKNTVEDGADNQIVIWNSLSIWEKKTCKSSDGMFGDGLNRFIAYHNTGILQNVPFGFAVSETEIPLSNELVIYNAFSPDGDNKNDTWKIKNIESYPENSLTIVNRWGDEVYNAKSYNNNKAWDGGSLASGTYFYALEVNVSGKKKIYKGFITLIKRD